MFWTAMIWGAGVSLGACVGLFTFVIVFGLLRLDTKEARQIAKESLEALCERNRLSVEQIGALEAIARSLEQKAD